MIACICGGILESWLLLYVLGALGLGGIGTELFNRWRRRCHCQDACCGSHDKKWEAAQDDRVRPEHGGE